jgi:trans-aconitate 2-methyltransferase
MTEWDASGYAQISELQQAMSAEALGLLALRGDERILDVGCGNGRVTSEIAGRAAEGAVVGVDASEEMIAFANGHYHRANLSFRVADARRLPFDTEFDLVVSFNALHWIPEQDQALTAIARALRPGGTAQLRLVPQGPRPSLEDTLEETRQNARWAPYFSGFRDPYLRLRPEQYVRIAERSGLKVERLGSTDWSWDFGSRAGFRAFGLVTFVEWTKHLPASEQPAFVEEVLDRYRLVAAAGPGEEHTFKFYQMDITLVVPQL